jgi:hypothetical protein
MKYLFVASATLISILISGCGTFLAISELDSREEADMKKPDGLVVNRRGQYKVEVSISDNVCSINTNDCTSKVVKNDSKIVTGVDHNKVIKLDVNRMPFSDGKLNVKLNEFQLMKEVELTSKTGASKAATAAQTGIDKHREIKTLLKKPESEQNNTDGASK